MASTEDNKTLQNLHSGRVRLAEAAQKKRKNRKGANGSSKKRGTGFEGESPVFYRGCEDDSVLQTLARAYEYQSTIATRP